MALVLRIVENSMPHQSEVREKVIDLLSVDNILCISDLVKLTNVSWGTMYHHLRVLEESKIIDTENYLGKTWVLKNKESGRWKLQVMLRHPTCLKVAECLQEGGWFTNLEVSLITGAHPKMSWHHLEKLVREGGVEVCGKRPRAYRASEKLGEILGLGRSLEQSQDEDDDRYDYQ